MQFDIESTKVGLQSLDIVGYLDIQTSRIAKPRSRRRSYDYSQMAVVSGLPVFPTLGLKEN